MPTPNTVFESLKEQFAKQNDALRGVFNALESLPPWQAIAAADPQIVQAFEDACNATTPATQPIALPMGIRA